MEHVEAQRKKLIKTEKRGGDKGASYLLSSLQATPRARLHTHKVFGSTFRSNVLHVKELCILEGALTVTPIPCFLGKEPVA